MDFEVEGRHALLFDDDAAAAFVNSPDALVEWNSLLIDRYDVRHLLSSPPLPRKFTRRDWTAQSAGALESEIERERFLDMPQPPSCEDEDPEVEGKANDKGFHSVAFSYGNGDENDEHKVYDTDAGHRPSFPLPESLLQHLPKTDKVHQIIARTALFVREHGGQSEIVLRVKQGDNPTFGFLMPDHQLHPYFRYLIDHPEILTSERNGKSSEVASVLESEPASAGGALSLLGSTYGSGEDEDILDGTKLDSNERKSNVTVGDSVSGGLGYGKPLEVATLNAKQILTGRSSSKDKAAVIKKKRSSVTVKSEGEIANKKNGEVPVGKAKSGGGGGMKVEQHIVEPPSDVKRLIDKIVDFITKNGKEFEAVLVEQDKNYGKFSFLLPSSHYHPYYLAVLNKSEKSKLTGRRLGSEKDDLINGDEKNESSPPLGSDVPYESDRKGKFRMIIGRMKKDDHEQLSKESQQQAGVGVDVDAAAAILQAVRKGIKNPTLEIFPKASHELDGRGTSREDRESTSVSSDKVSSKAETASAAEADSAEAHLTKVEKLKAERLRRAKMFTSMLKSGAAPLKTHLSRGSSLETPKSEVSAASTVAKFPLQGREGISGAMDVSAPDNVRESESKASVDEQVERRSKRRYRSRAETHVEEPEYEDEEDEEGDKFNETKHKHSRKKRRSHRSSHHSRERHKHRKGLHRHESSDDEPHGSYQHRHESSPDYNDNARKSHRNHESKRDHSSDDDDRRDDHRHRKLHDHKTKHREESDKMKRRSHPSKRELEEGEILAATVEKASDNTSITRRTSDVNNDFRAKIRAMLMSTM